MADALHIASLALKQLGVIPPIRSISRGTNCAGHELWAMGYDTMHALGWCALFDRGAAGLGATPDTTWTVLRRMVVYLGRRR